MAWTQDSILRELRKLKRQKLDLSYNRLAKTHQPLVSAAAYHFGSYRNAIEAMGTTYAEIARRPRWTKENVIELIKSAAQRGDDLHWSAVIARGDDLGRAAFASLQPRLFGRWDDALAAAGLDAGAVARYRRWDKPVIVAELKQRERDGRPLNSGALQQQAADLHAAAVRYFGDFQSALEAAGLDPDKFRQRRRWTKAQVFDELRALHKRGERVSDSVVRKQNAALYGAAVRLFGTFTAARTKAGIKLKRGG
ncbi:MAG: hypothetical protein AAF743_10355 [Planctomycetota bacterium]